ncbi:MAG: hypothetical protein M1821_007569 [Bathelium mastoideum]|nr:MAG: hypothetical protein M1821_007569 [Bathelium mastoideum]KAI9675466.1 MAG: hypothetical protein M1822_008944 [Bathelium mastoideum]
MGPGTPSKLDERRVLGNLSPNTKIGSRTPTAADFRNPKLLFTEEAKTPSLPPVGLFSSPTTDSTITPVRTGQKRRIDQVDDPADSPDRDTRTSRDRAEDEIKSVQANAADALLHSPSVRPSVDEEHTPEVEERATHPRLASQDSSMTQASFSSLINYNPNNVSSQQDETADKVASSEVDTVSATSRAEVLRLRLRVAMYKVQTNQVNVPLSRLQLRSSPATTQPSTPTTLASPVMTASPSKPSTRNLGHERGQSSATQDASRYTRASTPKLSMASASLGSPLRTPDPIRTGRDSGASGIARGLTTNSASTHVSRLLPGPVLKPTAYSSRFISASYTPSMEALAVNHSIHSRSSSSASQGSGTETASLASPPSEISRVQSTDAGSEVSAPADEVADPSPKLGKDVEMTDVEDDAANGLLELMHAGTSAPASE